MNILKPVTIAFVGSLVITLMGTEVVHAQAQPSDSTSQSSSSPATSQMPSGSESSGSSSGTATSAGASSSNAASGAAASKLDSADSKMMMQLAQANIAEIETAKIALNQTKNPDVLAFAQKMIDDHTQASNELMALAQAKGVSLPTKPDAKHQALTKKMAHLKDAQFDKQYMANAGRADHQATLTLLKRISNRAADPEFKALATKMQPIVEQHLDTAKAKK